jgi:flagellar transcriptional activator FlhC
MNGETLRMDLTRASTSIRFKDAGIVRLAACTVLVGHAAARFST